MTSRLFPVGSVIRYERSKGVIREGVVTAMPEGGAGKVWAYFRTAPESVHDKTLRDREWGGPWSITTAEPEAHPDPDPVLASWTAWMLTR